jgi:hypothetical protein
MTKRAVVAGGSGFIGAELLKQLKTGGYETVVLSRSSKSVESADRVAVWDAESVGDWAKELEGADAVFNLAGSSILSKWTPEQKQRILDSRVNSTEAIGKAIQQCQVAPKAWLNGSAVGYYGNTGDHEVSEGSAPGDDFLARVCKKWEKAIDRFDLPETRQSKVRIGFVLGENGGAMKALLPLTKAFLGGAVGSGRQFVPWIHIEDLARLMVWTAESDIEGAVNGVAPNPVRNADFMARLRSHAGRPPAPPAPMFMLRLAEKLGGPPAEVVASGQRAVPFIPLGRGFVFKYPELDDALSEIVNDVPVAWQNAG